MYQLAFDIGDICTVGYKKVFRWELQSRNCSLKSNLLWFMVVSLTIFLKVLVLPHLRCFVTDNNTSRMRICNMRISGRENEKAFLYLILFISYFVVCFAASIKFSTVQTGSPSPCQSLACSGKLREQEGRKNTCPVWLTVFSIQGDVGVTVHSMWQFGCFLI